MHTLLVFTSCLVAAWTVGGEALQESRPPREQAKFRSAVELVSVDASVLDRNGRPIEGLQASDFALTVDGRPRRVVSAEFVRLTPSSAPAPAATHYSSNAHRGTGRLVALVVDQGNISTGRARAAAESAIRFIKRLSPMDRVALFAIPPPGPRIGFTLNHALVQSQLPRITGHATAASGANRLSLVEASRIERGDQMTLNTATDRECSNADRLNCTQELEAEARELISDARDRARASLGQLRALMQHFSESTVPKTVVFLSEALVIDEDRPGLEWLGPLAAKGRVTLHVLRIDPPAADASARRSFNRSGDGAVAEAGLSLLASLTRGSLYRVAGNADNIVNRLSLEISGYYLLGFEPETGDRDGKPHKIEIDLPSRRGLDVRSRQEFAVEKPRVLTNEDALAETLRSPLLAADVGLKVTTYTFREATSDKLRILIAADIDRSQSPSGPLALGYALVDPGGSIVASQFEPQVRSAVDTETMTQHFMAATVAAAPGIYGLKLAVVDETGKRGSVEHVFSARLAEAGQIQSGDLLIGEEAGTGSSGTAAAVDASFADPNTLYGYLELYGASSDALQKASVTVEIASRGDSRALESVPARFNEADSTTSRKVGEAVLPIGLLPPGDYQARAIISVDGRKAGQVSRPFRVSRSMTAPTASAGIPRRARRTNPFTVRIDPFRQATVLTPDVVGFFVQRMSSTERGVVTADAIEHARAGRFDAAADAAKESGHTLAATFLAGVGLYARGDFESAASKFREALRIDSEFFPAAFYIGACYAANGRDRDASAAWQTSLASDTDAPFVYTLLADAFLRQRELDRAIEILNEAKDRWPDEPEVQMRLGAALAMNGKPADALRALEAYLAHRPADAERLFLALQILYESYAAGRPIGSPEEDRARFARFAAAYASAKGPQAALVAQWTRFMERQ